MAQKKISELTAAGALTGAELVPIVQSGATVRTTTQDIADLGGGGVSDWGDIGGTLSNQTDLQAALDAKEALYRTFDRKIADYPLVLSDSTKGIEMNVAGANTVTVPLNATQAFPVGTLIPIVQYGAGLTSIAAADVSITIHTSAGNLDSPGQYAPMFLRKIATNEWYLWNGTAGGGGAVDSVNGQTGVVVLDAGDIANTPAGGIAATDVQAAINELDTEKQPIDSDLTTIAGLSPSNDDFLQRKAGAWANRTVAQVKTDLGIVAASESTAGILEISTQAETDAGTNDITAVSPLKLRAQFRRNATKTTGYTVAQSDEGSILRANSASAIAFDFPSLTEGTIIQIIQIAAGDATWTNSGGTSFIGNLTSLPGGTVGIATFIYRSTTVIEVIGGIPTSQENLAITGTLSVKAGASSGTIAKVGGVIHSAFAAVGNVTTGEDTLLSFPLPANTLSTDGQSVRLVAYITFAANANNKTLKVKFGATTGYDSTALAINNAAAVVRVVMDIVRTGAATQNLEITITPDNSIIGTLVSRQVHATAAETLSGAVNVIITGEGTATNDIVKASSKIIFEPTA